VQFPSCVEFPARMPVMMHEKIGPHHLQRKAILYRQSSAHQVLHNRESSALQYAVRDRLAALGWSHIETTRKDVNGEGHPLVPAGI
jgi:hypothetical protein